MKLVHVVTVPMSFRLLRGQAEFMSQRGLDVHAISSPGPLADAYSASEPVTVHTIPMRRRMSAVADLVALARLWTAIRSIRPDIVQAGTPKGGLLGILAAWFAGVPVRVYQVRGLPMLTARGAKRAVLWSTERLACAAATHVLCVSHSMKSALLESGLCEASKPTVLLDGSSNGVDANGRFNPERNDSSVRGSVRARFGIPDAALVIGFVGRLVREKGIIELWHAWVHLRTEFPDAHLLLVGPFENDGAVPGTIRQALLADERVHVAGLEWETAPLYAAMDVFCLPSHR
jgi:glycosyltransferase involved in cell wall biosynthesis